MRRLVALLEEMPSGVALGAMVCLPLAEVVVRAAAGGAIPGGLALVQHLTLWVAFLGAALAAREDRLLALATGQWLPAGRGREVARGLAYAVSAAVAGLLCQASFELVRLEHGIGGLVLPWLPRWVAQLALPVGFGAIALRLGWRVAARPLGRILGFASALLGAWLGASYEVWAGGPLWPALVVLFVSTALGGPIFAALGGIAAWAFIVEGIQPAVVLAETYRLSVSPTLPAIPLFTLVGFLLAEGRASERLLRVFRAFFGWVPGGTAVVCAMLCAFFTVPTGGSGVTILALGGLLLQALLRDGYRDRFAVGLLTASGSLGLLIPPALPLILYGIVAEVPMERLFLGGVVPGALLVSLIALWGVREGFRTGRRAPFDAAEARRALWEAKWELALPVVALVAIFGGFATLVEAAALTAAYTLVVQCLVHREISLGRGLFRVLTKCNVLIGGVLSTLGVAMGLTNYLVDAQIPQRMLAWVQGRIDSPLVFLLCLNVFLLLVGCLMDIFSATVVVVPLIVPLGLAYGLDPVHLGIVFVANLELGYLTPPVGLNLFLASYRLERPLLEVCRAALPGLGILAVGVVLITYIPPLTTTLPRLLQP